MYSDKPTDVFPDGISFNNIAEFDQPQQPTHYALNTIVIFILAIRKNAAEESGLRKRIVIGCRSPDLHIAAMSAVPATSVLLLTARSGLFFQSIFVKPSFASTAEGLCLSVVGGSFLWKPYFLRERGRGHNKNQYDRLSHLTPYLVGVLS